MSYRLFILSLFSFPLAAEEFMPLLPFSPLWLVIVGLVIALCLALGYVIKLKRNVKKLKFKKQKTKLGFYSLHDDISGFPNKFFLQQKLDKLLAKSGSNSYALILIKISQFDKVNQLLGHSHGNVILSQIAQRINDMLENEQGALMFEKRQDSAIRLCHLGGVDFAIWLDTTKNGHDEQYLATLLERNIADSMIIHGCTVNYRLKVGISKYPEHGTQLNELIERAYLALEYHRLQVNQSKVFDHQMLKYTNEKLVLMAELSAAINDNQLSLYVQPQVDMKTKEVLAGEVFIRWRHPKRGLLAPESFLDVAVEMGVIYSLTQWVLNESIKMASELKRLGLSNKIAVNISSKDLLHDEFFDALEQLFEKYDVEPSRLMLELKESALLDEPVKAMSMMQRLHRLGVALVLDDFGTGLSSLAYLRKLPIEHVKIDGSFISSLHKSELNIAITGAIIDMARNLDLIVIAEGIEEAAVEHKLLSMGCNRGQGFYYSHPFELEGFAPWLKKHYAPVDNMTH